MDTFRISDPIFIDEDKAREHLEAQRWPDGPVCPHCGVTKEHVKAIKGARSKPSKAHPEGVERKGLYQCNACRKQFTATVGTVFERSKIPLTQWLLATYLLTTSKKGMSAHQLHRMLKVTYKTAWFMFHRIRMAMGQDADPLGGEGQTVEADETYFGPLENPPKVRKDGTPFQADVPGSLKGINRGFTQKRIILGLVERGGNVKTFHVQDTTKATVGDIVRRNVRRESRLHTDQAHVYKSLGGEFKGGHESVNHHKDEYVRGDVHTNSIEGYWSIFKRGMVGVYQHCSEKHLHRYLAEFEFRYNRRTALGFDDEARAKNLLRRIEGKRLTYRRIGEAAHA